MGRPKFLTLDKYCARRILSLRKQAISPTENSSPFAESSSKLLPHAGECIGACLPRGRVSLRGRVGLPVQDQKRPAAVGSTCSRTCGRSPYEAVSGGARVPRVARRGCFLRPFSVLIELHRSPPVAEPDRSSDEQ